MSILNRALVSLVAVFFMSSATAEGGLLATDLLELCQTPNIDPASLQINWKYAACDMYLTGAIETATVYRLVAPQIKTFCLPARFDNQKLL